MRRSLSALLFLPLLVGCGQLAEGEPYAVKNDIMEVSFRAARGTVPDTWLLLFCKVETRKNCFTRSISHSPWAWQKAGTKITVKWQKYTGGHTHDIQYILTDTGEVVSL